mgnify:CR=1 FL=1
MGETTIREGILADVIENNPAQETFRLYREGKISLKEWYKRTVKIPAKKMLEPEKREDVSSKTEA